MSRTRGGGVTPAAVAAERDLHRHRRAFARRLLRWYDANRRDLPWRRSPTPYRTLVSEVMLQQTRVDVVVPYFRRFLRRFPSLSALARASEQDVLKAWEGLGYYRRARNLRLAAIRVSRNGRRLPGTCDGLRALPGLGDYTAAAVAAIAFGRREAAVDGNVERVMARLLGRNDAIGRAGFRRTAREALRPLVPRARPGDFAQGMMELGATVCSPCAPACSRCPLRPFCRTARRAGRSGRPPALARRAGRNATRRLVHEQAIVVLHRRRLLVRKRPSGGLLGAMWGLPAYAAGSDPTGALAADTGFGVRAERTLSPIVHDYSHFRLVLTPIICTTLATPSGFPRRNRRAASRGTALSSSVTLKDSRRAPSLPPSWRWLPLSRLADLPMGRADRLAIAAAGYDAPSRRGRAVPSPPRNASR